MRRVTLSAPTWTAETANAPAYCRVDGVIDPVDTSATARPINFGVALPARWNRRSVQMGGGGMNGTVPGLTGGGPGSPSLLARGFVTYGSDSGHQAGFGFRWRAAARVGRERPARRAAARPGSRGCLPPRNRRRGSGPGRTRRCAPCYSGSCRRRRTSRRSALGGGGPAPADDWALNDEAIATSATCR